MYYYIQELFHTLISFKWLLLDQLQLGLYTGLDTSVCQMTKNLKLIY